MKPGASHRPAEPGGSPCPSPCHDWPFTLSLPHHLHMPARQNKQLGLHMAPCTDEQGVRTHTHPDTEPQTHT